MENHGTGIKGNRGIGNDSSIVPAFSFGIIHKEHVVAESSSKTKFSFVGGSNFGVFGICYGKIKVHLRKAFFQFKPWYNFCRFR